MRLVSALTLACFWSAACAHNPARPIVVNDEEVQVHEESADVPGETPGAKPILFTRAADPLDEQEFYASINDTTSLDVVQSSRRTGSFLQGVGVGMAVIGFLAAAAGLAAFVLSNDSIFTPPPLAIAEDMRTLPLYGGIGGAVLGAGGIGLIAAMAGKVRGDSLIFDLAHARHSLEVNLYGENGATPDDVKSLTFGEGDEGKRICAAGDLTLAPLVARDAKGRKMRVSERADWFTWTTTPRAGLVTQAPDAPVLSSPLIGGLGDVDSEVGVTIAIASTNVGHSMTFDQSFACSTLLGRDGSSGSMGSSGSSGRSGSSGGGSGSSGGDGGDGTDGSEGPSVVAEVTWVKTPKRGRLALLVVGREARLFDPTQTTATVSAAGGSGGSGGRGGSGGSGGSGSSGHCQSGGNGGSGGRGGRGGNGGRGGRVTIRATDRALLDAVTGIAPGGSGGYGGEAGSGGSKGSGSSCKGKGSSWAPDGARGSSGSSGSRGSSGPDGSVEEELASAASLRSLASVLAENPQLKVEEGAFAGPAPRPSRKRR